MPGFYTRNGFLDPQTAQEILSATNPFYSEPQMLGLPESPPLNEYGISPERYQNEILTKKYAGQVVRGTAGTIGAVHRAALMHSIVQSLGGGYGKPSIVAPGRVPVTLQKLGAATGNTLGYLGVISTGSRSAAEAYRKQLLQKQSGIGIRLLEYLLPIRAGKGLLAPLRAGLKSFYGWNVLMGIDDSATLSDYMGSLAKHVVAGYGIRALTSFVAKRTSGVVGLAGAVVGRIGSSKLTESFVNVLKDTGYKDTFGRLLKQHGLKDLATNVTNAYNYAASSPNVFRLMREFSSLRSSELKKLTKLFAGIGTEGRLFQARFKRMIAMRATPELQAASIGPIVQQAETAGAAAAEALKKRLGAFGAQGEYKGVISATSGYMRSRAKYLRLKVGEFFTKDTAEQALERQMQMKAASQAATTAGREARAFLGARVAQTIGFGMRMANVYAGATMAVMAVRAMQDYKKESLREYISTMYNVDTTYNNFPQYQMDGTERQRAIQAIQESNLNIRNALGNEAVFMH